MDKNLLRIGEAVKLLGVSIDTLRRWDRGGKFLSVRVSSAGNRYYRRADIDLFIKNPQAVAQNWAASPLSYEPESQFYCKTRDVFQARLEHFQVESEKEKDGSLFSLISAVAGEIGNNSFDHNLGNWPDILGIYFSYSLTEKKIILADRGVGVLSTLKKVRPGLKSHADALKVAFTEMISGRASEARGNGLKFVREVILRNPMRLIFQTGDAVLKLKQGKQSLEIEITEKYIRGCMAVVEY